MESQRYFNHLMGLLQANPELHKFGKGILQQVAYGATCSLIGGVVGGPPGAMIGGFVGCVIGYIWSDDYQSLIKVIQRLSDEDKAKLVTKVQKLVNDVTTDALTQFLKKPAHVVSLFNLIRSAASKGA